MLVCLRIIKRALGTTLHVPERELEMSDTVRLVRDGHDPVNVLPSQVTPLSIAWIFLVILVYFTFRCVAIGQFLKSSAKTLGEIVYYGIRIKFQACMKFPTCTLYPMGERCSTV